MNEKQYQNAIKILNEWAHAYYTLDKPIASDAEYDELYRQILNYEAKNPLLIASNSPSRRVGAEILKGFEKMAHIKALWSMEDIFDQNELKEWLERGNKQNLELYIEPKFDGASLNLLYENGQLFSAITRGDGKIGENVTQNARTITSIPLTIPYKERIEIRGEVLITKSDFNAINQELTKQGKQTLANPRNAAAGSLRQLDSAITRSRRLKFYPWGVGENNLKFTKHNQIMEFIHSLGFLQDEFCVLCVGLENAQNAYNELLRRRQNASILMDGMVLRLNDVSQEEKFGYTVKFPRFMVAYKFPALEKSTIILDVVWQVGRTGALTPKAICQSVNIDGANVQHATLHNYDEICRLGVKIGDVVSIIRSGDVIPKITGVLRPGKEQKEIIKPKFCPQCDSKLFDDGAILKCQNLACKARVLNNMIYFASKKCMNIDGLSSATIRLFYELGLIKNISDLYRLKQSDLENLEGFKDKKITNLLNAIAASKTPSLERFIASLGIELIGEVAAKKIAQHQKQNWRNASYDELISIDGFGENMAKSYLEFMRINREKIDELLSFITPKIQTQTPQTSQISNKTFVLTGTLSAPRQSFKERIEALGGRVSSAISSNTDFLLCGQNAGSKLNKAKELGVEILNEAQFNALIAQNNE
ncbi:MAG: DNA ligase, NAD-dependent [Candidatus Campylobacter infans]|nr:MAG: DNA ligase, NAD-dependent [Candidatus Campylobacter infans]